MKHVVAHLIEAKPVLKSHMHNWIKILNITGKLPRYLTDNHFAFLGHVKTRFKMKYLYFCKMRIQKLMILQYI